MGRAAGAVPQDETKELSTFTIQARQHFNDFIATHQVTLKDDSERTGPSDHVTHGTEAPDNDHVDPAETALPPFDERTNRTKRTQHKLSQVLFIKEANALWRLKQWREAEGERGSRLDLRLIRARYLSISSPGSSAFLLAVPSRETRLNATIWSVVIRRHLGLKLYDDTHRPLLCSHSGVQWNPEEYMPQSHLK